jgi:hypothetical protein
MDEARPPQGRKKTQPPQTPMIRTAATLPIACLPVYR